MHSNGETMTTTQTLKDLQHPQVSYVHGPEIEVHGVRQPEHCDSESLTFVSTKDSLTEALKRKPGILIALNKLDLTTVPTTQTLFSCSYMPGAMAAILSLFDQTQTCWQQEPRISPLAYIHPSARIGPHVIIQAHAWIGAHVTIGAHCRIGAHSVIQDRSLIGQSSVIHPNVFIGTDTELGVYCEIHPNCTLAAPGFGFATDSQFKHQKIPQVGRVIIGDHVRIGSNCTVNRATFEQTRIKSGTKMDDHCHVAHNCTIGEDSILTAGFMMAGSTQIGNRFLAGGSSVIADHITITDDVKLGSRAVVTNDIKEKGQYGGYPLQPLKLALKTVATLTHLVQIRKQLSKISKHLNLEN